MLNFKYCRKQDAAEGETKSAAVKEAENIVAIAMLKDRIDGSTITEDIYQALGDEDGVTVHGVTRGGYVMSATIGASYEKTPRVVEELVRILAQGTTESTIRVKIGGLWFVYVNKPENPPVTEEVATPPRELQYMPIYSRHRR